MAPNQEILSRGIYISNVSWLYASLSAMAFPKESWELWFYEDSVNSVTDFPQPHLTELSFSEKNGS